MYIVAIIIFRWSFDCHGPLALTCRCSLAILIHVSSFRFLHYLFLIFFNLFNLLKRLHSPSQPLLSTTSSSGFHNLLFYLHLFPLLPPFIPSSLFIYLLPSSFISFSAFSYSFFLLSLILSSVSLIPSCALSSE